MQTKHLCVLIHIWTKGEVGVPLNLKPSSKIFYWPFQGGASFVDHLCYFCLVLLCFHARLFFMPCGHLLGKGWPLGSRLWCLIVTLSLFAWYHGSGVVLDCIDSWSLPSFLLWHRPSAFCCSGRHCFDDVSLPERCCLLSDVTLPKAMQSVPLLFYRDTTIWPIWCKDFKMMSILYLNWRIIYVGFMVIYTILTLKLRQISNILTHGFLSKCKSEYEFPMDNIQLELYTIKWFTS